MHKPKLLAPVRTLCRDWFSDGALQPVLVLDALLPEDAVLPGQLVPLGGLLHVVPVPHKYLGSRLIVSAKFIHHILVCFKTF